MILIDIRKSNKLKDSEYSAFIKFDYNSKIVDAIRELPFRYYNPSETEWEVPTNKVEYLINKLKEFDIKICGKITIFEDKNTNIGLPEGFEFKTKPFSHQLEGVEYGLKYDRWFLGDEQGLGKSKQVIDIAVARKVMYGYRFCLIVCGVNTLKWNWVNEIHTHSKEDAYILGQRRKGTKIRIGSTKDKLEDLKLMYDIKQPHPYFIITNVESFRDKNIADTISDLCKKGIIGMCAADEMHKCFDYNTQIRTDKGLLKIGEIVTSKIKCNVLSYNENSKSFEYKPITNYFENFVNERLMCLTIKTENGEFVKIKCTDTHKFYTRNRGWVCAKDLTEFDDIVSIYT